MKQKLLLLGLVAAAVFGLVLLAWQSAQSPQRESETQVESPSPAQTETLSVTQQISAGELSPEPESFLVSEGESALDLLKRTRIIELKEYDFGALVESVDGLTNGTDDKSWIFYINGQMASVGADAYQLREGDQIEWRFQAYEQ